MRGSTKLQSSREMDWGLGGMGLLFWDDGLISFWGTSACSLAGSFDRFRMQQMATSSFSRRASRKALNVRVELGALFSSGRISQEALKLCPGFKTNFLGANPSVVMPCGMSIVFNLPTSSLLSEIWLPPKSNPPLSYRLRFSSSPSVA